MWPFKKEEIVIDDEARLSKIDEELDREAKWEQFLNKYKMGRHHRIERTLLLMAGMSVLMAGGVSMSYAGYVKKNTYRLGAQAIYTEHVKFSKDTAVDGEVVLVGRSPDRKIGYLLLKFKDPNSVSSDAKNYQVWVSAYEQRLKNEFQGEIFTFGGEGYLGVRLYDERGIKSQLLDVTIRANKNVSKSFGDNEDITTNTNYGKSFKEFNQSRIYANFGAKKASIIDLADDATGVDLYYTLVAKAQDDELIKSFVENNRKLAILIERMDEYRSRIEAAGYERPSVPEVFKSLKVTDKGMLETTKVLPGGYQIEAGRRLKDGYLSEFIIGDINEASILNLLAVKSAEAGGTTIQYVRGADGSLTEVDVSGDESKVKGVQNVESDAVRGVLESLTITELRKSDDGSILNVSALQQDKNTTAQLAVGQDVKSLNATYQEMYQLLKESQVTINSKRVKLDESLRAQSVLYTQVGGDDHFALWQQR